MVSHSVLFVQEATQDVDRVLSALSRVIAPEQIKVCPAGEEAIQFLSVAATNAERGGIELPRLVLIDLMPGSYEGVAVLRAIRNDARTRLMPVVVLAPPGNHGEVDEVSTLGPNSLIRKVMEPGRLSDNVALLARYWLYLNIPPPLPN